MNSVSQPEIVILPDAPSLAREAAARMSRAAARAIGARGRFAVALSGGKTPLGVFESLRSRPDLDWQHCEIFWVDERAVPPSHPESNFGAAEAALFRHVPIPAPQIHRMPADSPDLERAAAEYAVLLQRVLGVEARLDLVLLGLGADGHTASLFPHRAALSEHSRLVAATSAPVIAPRLTLTYPAFDAAREVLFIVSGAEKSHAVQETLFGPQDPERLPAQGVHPRDGVVTWLLDLDAASGVEGLDLTRPGGTPIL